MQVGIPYCGTPNRRCRAESLNAQGFCTSSFRKGASFALSGVALASLLLGASIKIKNLL